MRLISAVLLSALAACVYCVCPPPEDMPKECRCRERWPHSKRVSVNCFGGGRDTSKIEEIAAVLRAKVPSSTAHIENLNINGFRDALSSKIFDGLNVEVLTINNCRFERWADEVGGPAFVGLEDSLKELFILSSIFVNGSYSEETEFPAPFSLGHLRQVTKVKIFKNRLYVFGNDWFGKGGSSVNELDIEQNELHVIGDEAVVGLTNMRNFKAELNHITVLERSMFPEETKLWLLDMRNNDLEGFPEDFFVNFPSLQKIELNGNPIVHVPEEVFGKIWQQLDYIDFKDTPLHCDDHINWMLEFKQPEDLLGWCQTPPELSGQNLENVLYRRGKSSEESDESDESYESL